MTYINGISVGDRVEFCGRGNLEVGHKGTVLEVRSDDYCLVLWDSGGLPGGIMGGPSFVDLVAGAYLSKIKSGPSKRAQAQTDLVPCPICHSPVKPINLERHKERHKSKYEKREPTRQEEIGREKEEKPGGRQDEEARAQALQQMRLKIKVKAERKSSRQCVMCGRPLTLLARLLGRDRHSGCTIFRNMAPNGDKEFAAMDDKKIFAYHFYRREPNGEDQYIGSLTEKRKKPERITHASIMNWAKLHAPKDVFEDRVYFLRVQI